MDFSEYNNILYELNNKNLLLDNISSIDEAYFINPNVEQAVNQLKSIKHYYQKANYMSVNDFNDFNTNPLVLKFNRIIEKIFGFKTFTINIDICNEVNAYTCPIGFRLDTDLKLANKYIIKDLNGYRFVKPVFSTMVYLTSKLIVDKTFSERDVMAIILHEIGHNFELVLNNGVGICDRFESIYMVFGYLRGYFDVWLTPEAGEMKAKQTMNDYEKLKLYKLANHIKNKDSFTINTLGTFIKPIVIIYYLSADIINLLLKITQLDKILFAIGTIIKLKLFKNPLYLLQWLCGYDREKIADNFATMYGFGYETAKFENDIYQMNKESIKNGSIVNKFWYLILSPFISIAMFEDAHPDHSVRILDQIYLLENELEKENLDPAIKKDIKLHLKKCREVYNKYLDNIDKYEYTFKARYKKLMIELFGGSIKEIFHNKDKRMLQYDSIKDKEE